MTRTTYLLPVLAIGLAVAVPQTVRARPKTSSETSVKAVEPALEKAATKVPAKATAAAPSKATEQAAPGRSSKKAAAKEEPLCLAPEIHLVRVRGDDKEHRQLSLTLCDGTVRPTALDSLSVLARARDVERPLIPEIKAYRRRSLDRGPLRARRKADHLSEQVMLIHPGLLERLQKVANQYPGKTVEIISGHRPDARATSRHHHARALDFRVEGVSRERLRDFVRSLDDTGVGYYPNSTFVHMDVREGRGYWVDRSLPGEPADYGRWPLPNSEVAAREARVVESVRRELATLGLERAGADSRRATADTQEERGEDALSNEEIARIRQDALQALSAL